MLTSHIGIHQGIIDGNLVNAVVSLNEVGVQAKFVFDAGRQTGGYGSVVSDPAVLDAQSHVRSIPVIFLSVPPDTLACNLGGCRRLDQPHGGSIVSRAGGGWTGTPP